MNNKKKIYIVSSSLGVHHDSHAIRILNYLPPDDKKYEVIPIGIGNGRIGDFEIIDSGFIPMTNVSKIKHVKYSIKWFRENFIQRVVYPDKFKGWSKSLLDNFCHVINLDDVLITASGSIEAHKFGLKLKEFIPEVRWIADFGDPWWSVERESRPWFSYIAHKDEKEILKNADQVIVTTEETKRQFLCNYPSSQIHVIHYGYSEFIYQSSCIDKNVIITGQIGSGHVANRNLLPFLRALEKSDTGKHIQILLAGDRSAVFDEYVNNSERLQLIKSIDRVSYEESIYLISKQTMFLIVGNESNLQIPGKIFVAIGSNIPIFYISQTENDPAKRILHKIPGVIISSSNDESEISIRLEEFFDKEVKLKKLAQNRRSNDTVKKYSREANWSILKNLLCLD